MQKLEQELEAVGRQKILSFRVPAGSCMLRPGLAGGFNR